MWADTVQLNVGGWLLGVRADTNATATRIRRLFREHLSQSGPRMPSNYSVRGASRWFRRHDAELYVGGSLVARSRALDDVLIDLARLLAGLVDVEAHACRVGMRLFVKDDVGVLAHTEAPALIDHPTLRSAGVIERVVWHPEVDLDLQQVREPAELPNLDWTAIRAPHHDAPEPSWRLAGLTTRPTDDGTPDFRFACSLASQNRDRWLRYLGDLQEAGRVLPADTDDAAADAILTLLGRHSARR